MQENRHAGFVLGTSGLGAIDSFLAKGFRARWCPIYLEPIPHSGELLACGIAVVDQAGEFLVKAAFSKDIAVRCFGDAGGALFNIAGLVVADLQAHLAARAPLESWQPSFQGVWRGEIRASQDESLENIAKQVLRNVACLHAKQAQTEEEFHEDDAEAKRWQSAIRKLVTGYREEFGGYFHASVKLNMGASVKVGFAGGRLVASFARINLKNLSHSVGNAKSRMVDVSMVKQNAQELIPFLYHDLILQCPELPVDLGAHTKQDYSNSITLIESFCDKHEIFLMKAANAEDAARHIYRREASIG